MYACTRPYIKLNIKLDDEVSLLVGLAIDGMAAVSEQTNINDYLISEASLMFDEIKNDADYFLQFVGR